MDGVKETLGGGSGPKPGDVAGVGAVNGAGGIGVGGMGIGSAWVVTEEEMSAR
jgi:hypothetical protein